MQEPITITEPKPEAKTTAPASPQVEKKAQRKGKANIVLVLAAAIALVIGLLTGGVFGSAIQGGMNNAGFASIEVSPLVVVGIVVLMMLVTLVFTSLVLLGLIRLKSPEALFFFMLRIRKQILVRLHFFNGREMWLAVQRSKDGLQLEAGGKPIGIDPTVLDEGKNSYFMGIEVIDYAVNNQMAIGLFDALGLFTVEEYYQNPVNGFESLKFLDPATVLYLYTTPESRLTEECQLNVSVDPNRITMKDLPEEYQSKKDGETDAAYKERLTVAATQVYTRLVDAEVNKLKNEVLKLKKETLNKVLISRVFTYHAAAAAMDVRLTNEASKKLKQIKDTQKGDTGAPNWFKWALFLGLGFVGFGVMCFLIFYGIKALTGA